MKNPESLLSLFHYFLTAPVYFLIVVSQKFTFFIVLFVKVKKKKFNRYYIM